MVQAISPEGRDGHGCQGTCGGRLHGICGSVVGDNEIHRMCRCVLSFVGKVFREQQLFLLYCCCLAGREGNEQLDNKIDQAGSEQ